MGCNPGASWKGELDNIKTYIPTAYIGEMSHTVYERSKEHWDGIKKWSEKNPMVKCQIRELGGSKNLTSP